MTAGHLIKVGAVSLGLLAVPAGIDTRALIVDSTGAPMGTVGNPVNITGSSGGGAVTQATTPWLVAGQLTHNNAVPAANNIGVLPAIANAASPTFTEGNQSLLSTDLSGLLRAKAAGFQAVGTAIASNPMIVAGQFSGNVKLLGLDTNGGIQQGAQNAAGAASWNIQGAGAATAAVAGNPVAMGGRDAAGNSQYIGGNNTGIFAQGTAAHGAAVAGNPVQVAFFDATQTTVKSPVVLTDNTDNNAVGSGALLVEAFAYDYDGSTSRNRHRNNAEFTLLASASRTTTQTSADIITYNAGAITVVYDNTVGSTYSDTLTIDGKDPASGKYYNLLTSAAIATVTTNVYVVDPTIPAVVNVSAQKRLPRTIRIVVTSGNANAHTYSVGYVLQPT